MNNENSNNDNYEKYKLIRHYENKINDFDKDRDTHYNTFKNKVYRLTDIYNINYKFYQHLLFDQYIHGDNGTGFIEQSKIFICNYSFYNPIY